MKEPLLTAAGVDPSEVQFLAHFAVHEPMRPSAEPGTELRTTGGVPNRWVSRPVAGTVRHRIGKDDVVDADWEEAAAELGLEIIEWGRPGMSRQPTELSGTVGGFDVTISTGGRNDYAPMKTNVTTHIVSLSAPIGPAGFEAKWRGRLYWMFVGGRNDQIRRAGRWALTADDLETLDSWLSTPLPAHLTSSGADRGAVFEKLNKVTSNFLFTAPRLTTWWISANEVALQRGKATRPAVFTDRVRTLVATAEALSS